MLNKSKAQKAKELLELLNKKSTKQNKIKNQNITDISIKNDKNTTINFVDCGKNLINYNKKDIKYIYINNQIYFKARDLAKILGYIDTDDSIRKHIDQQDKFELSTLTPGESPGVLKTNEYHNFKTQIGSELLNTIFINESGLYSLIFGSKKIEALNFKHWVTSEVLPSIRKNGYYEIIKPHNYLKDDLEKYRDKNCVYILNVKDDIYKYGQSHKLSNRLCEHVRKLDYINIVKIYEMDSINDILNLENKIKNLTKELKINITYNSGIEFFELHNVIKLNQLLDQIDSISNEIKQNNKLLNNQMKIENLTLIEIEKTKQLEIDYLKTTKTLELQNENLKLQIELLKLQKNQSNTNIDKPKSLIQHILDSKINNNDQTNSTQIINSNITINETIDKNKSCVDCGCDIYHSSIRCGKCENKKRLSDSLANNTRPSFAQLEADLIELKSYVKVSKKYGVSDNCIRKWINKYKSFSI